LRTWWEVARPAQRRLFLPPRPAIHVTRSVEQDLAVTLTGYCGYRRARWRAVILYGMAGIGKTDIARALADDDRVKCAFRDGIVWIDGSRDPEEEVTRLCLALNLERAPGERPVECWQRWAGAAERRLMLIIDDAVSAEGLTPFLAGLGPQVVTLITTQQSAGMRGEVERWSSANAVMEVDIHGLAPIEGRELVEAAVGRSLTDDEREIVQEIGELVGWHPEALRLAAIEGREVGWQGILGELRSGRLPWIEVSRTLMKQWARLHADQRAWLAALIERKAPGTGFTINEAARYWQVETTIAGRRLWRLERCGLLIEETGVGSDSPRWCVRPVAHKVLTGNMQQNERKRRDGQ
jgi:hypothetical protein